MKLAKAKLRCVSLAFNDYNKNKADFWIHYVDKNINCINFEIENHEIAMSYFLNLKIYIGEIIPDDLLQVPESN